ncbi:MAG TPA: GDSL-type esterase/lipase family protein [Thermoanaerobaculia bacterium]|nr:GDSL-type esterase/lipase family protein [Thermoanaerobaculia bacterium]
MSRSRLWLLRLALLAASLGLAVLLAEAVLRQGGAGPLVRRAEAAGITAHDRFLGWALLPGARDRQTSAEFDVPVRINAQGFRADREYSPEPPPGITRLVAVGDSFTFGNGVHVHEAWPAVLERRLDAEVINLGVAGYGVDQQLLMLESRGLDFQPDVVLLGLHTPDIFRSTSAVHNGTGKPRFRLVPQGGLALTNVPVPSPGSPLPPPPSRGPLHRFQLWRMLSTQLERHGVGEVWGLTEGILRRMERSASEAGARLVVLLLPPQYAVDGSLLERKKQAHTTGCIAGILRKNGIEHLDLTAALQARAEATGEPLFFPQDGHFTPAGHRVVAREVEKLLGD